MVKRYRVWLRNKRKSYVVGVGDNKEEALEYALENSNIEFNKGDVKSITLASN